MRAAGLGPGVLADLADLVTVLAQAHPGVATGLARAKRFHIRLARRFRGLPRRLHFRRGSAETRSARSEAVWAAPEPAAVEPVTVMADLGDGVPACGADLVAIVAHADHGVMAGLARAQGLHIRLTGLPGRIHGRAPVAPVTPRACGTGRRGDGCRRAARWGLGVGGPGQTSHRRHHQQGAQLHIEHPPMHQPVLVRLNDSPGQKHGEMQATPCALTWPGPQGRGKNAALARQPVDLRAAKGHFGSPAALVRAWRV